jgi:cytochrome c5
VRRVAAGALIAAACAALAIAAGAPGTSSRRPYADVFPAGEGRAIAERACMVCHSAMLVTQQAKDSTGWEKTLTQMAAWGAPPVLPAERDTLREYLLKHFGPRTTAAK